MLDTIYTFIIDLLNTIFFPIHILTLLLKLIYNTIFFLNIYMSNACVKMFGNGYGCKIIHPTYVFTEVLKYLLLWCLLVYVSIKIYEFWKAWIKRYN